MELTYATLAMTRLLVGMVAWCHFQARAPREPPTVLRIASPASRHPRRVTRVASPATAPELPLCARPHSVYPTQTRRPPSPSNAPAPVLSPHPPIPSLAHRSLRPCLAASPRQACLWGLLPQFEEGAYTWIEAFRAQHLSDHGASAGALTHWDLYVAAFYHSSMTVTGIGYGEMLPTTTSERAASAVLMLISGMLWCYIMGSFCTIATTLDPRSVQFRTNMDALNLFMRDRGLPRAARVLIRQYFHNTRHLQYANDEKRLVQMMSPLLQSSVTLAHSEKWLKKIWYFKADGLEGDNLQEHRAFIAAVSLKFEPEAYIQREQLPQGHLYVLRKGLICRRMRFWTAGTVWGEDMILENVDLIDFAQATAVTYIDVFTLSRQNLEDASRMFPTPAARLYRVSRRMMVQRLVIRYLRKQTNQQVKSFVPREQAKEAPLKDLNLEAKVDLLLAANEETKVKYEKLIGAHGLDESKEVKARLVRRPSKLGSKASSLLASGSPLVRSSSSVSCPPSAAASSAPAAKNASPAGKRLLDRSGAMQRLAQVCSACHVWPRASPLRNTPHCPLPCVPFPRRHTSRCHPCSPLGRRPTASFWQRRSELRTSWRGYRSWTRGKSPAGISAGKGSARSKHEQPSFFSTIMIASMQGRPSVSAPRTSGRRRLHPDDFMARRSVGFRVPRVVPGGAGH